MTSCVKLYAALLQSDANFDPAAVARRELQAREAYESVWFQQCSRKWRNLHAMKKGKSSVSSIRPGAVTFQGNGPSVVAGLSPCSIQRPTPRPTRMISDIIRICAVAADFADEKRSLLACETLFREEYSRAAARHALGARHRVEDARTALRELLQALPDIHV